MPEAHLSSCRSRPQGTVPRLHRATGEEFRGQTKACGEQAGETLCLMALLIPIADDPDKVIVRGEVRRIRLGFKYCSCGRPADFICDWKTNSRSGTCDLAVCSRCVLQVGPDKHLCEYDQK